MPFDLSSARPVGDVYPADVQRDRDRKRLDILQDEQRRYTDPASQKALKTEVADTKKKIGPTKFDLASAKPVGDGSAPAKPGAGKPAAKAEPPEDPTSFWNLAGAATEPMLAMGSGALGSVAGGLSGLGAAAMNAAGVKTQKQPGDYVRDSNEWIARCVARVLELDPIIKREEAHRSVSELAGLERWRLMKPEAAAEQLYAPIRPRS